MDVVLLHRSRNYEDSAFNIINIQYTLDIFYLIENQI